MKTILKIVATAALVLSFTACEEVKTNTELLTEATWTFSSFSNPDLDPDLADFYTALLTGAVEDYKADGTFTITYADSLFDQQTGTWEFNSEETVIIQDKGTVDEIEFTILTLDEMSLNYTIEDTSGVTQFNWTR